MSTQSMSGTTTLFPVYGKARSFGIPKDWQSFWRFLRRYGGGVLATLVLLVIIFSITFADRLTPHDPIQMDLRNRFAPPVWSDGGTMSHPLGTDNLGRDVLARTLYGGRVSLRVALTASTISTVVGLLLGLVSGYLGGIVDRVIALITNIWVSFPFLVLALAVIAAVGTSITVLVVLLSLAGWVYPARVTRAQTLRVRQYDYVDASIALGASPAHIIRHHIVPNVASINIILWTLSVGTLIIIESSLSFIGLGVSPPDPSWGNMLSSGQMYLQDAWWLSVFPGLALMLTILCINSLGDALQRMNDYRQQL
ncbi:MAG: ABC transporter permease [Chloroflexi bacterium]|nr:ABC transporter permease [Chloroflexota bacterium]